MADEVLTQRDGAVLTITFNRPEVYNAFNRELHAALREALTEAADASVRCVVVTGAGKGFCAGQDLKEFGEVSASIDESLEQTYHPNVRLIRSLEKPVLAAVNGPAAGAGLSFACACDLRVASEAATFVPGFIGIGLVPDAGGTWFIHRLLGFSRAFEWMSSNRRLSATEALEWGLVSEVIPGRRLRGARRRARRGVGRPPDACDREDEAALRARLRRGARGPARARGEAATGNGRHGGLRRGRQRVPREATAGVHRPLSDEASSMLRPLRPRAAPPPDPARARRRSAAEPADRASSASSSRIPHFIWRAVWGVVVVRSRSSSAGSSRLVLGRLPDGLHRFFAAYDPLPDPRLRVLLARREPVPRLHRRAAATRSTSRSRRQRPRTASRSSSGCSSRSPLSSSFYVLAARRVGRDVPRLVLRALRGQASRKGMRDLLAYWLRYQAPDDRVPAAPDRAVPVVHRPY